MLCRRGHPLPVNRGTGPVRGEGTFPSCLWHASTAGVTVSSLSVLRRGVHERTGTVGTRYPERLLCGQQARGQKKRKEKVLLEPGLSVLGEAVPAVHRSSFCRLEGHFAFLTAVRTDRLEHLTGAAGEVVPRTANSVAVHYVTYAVLTLHAYVRSNSINKHVLSSNPANGCGIPEYAPIH